MNLPFTIDDFLAVFAAYVLGLLAVTAVLVPRYTLMRLGLAALAILWAFTGIGYHLVFFARINPIAPMFAAFFVLQGILFLASATQPSDLRLRLGRDFRPSRVW